MEQDSVEDLTKMWTATNFKLGLSGVPSLSFLDFLGGWTLIPEDAKQEMRDLFL